MDEQAIFKERRVRPIDKPIHRNELIRLVRECIDSEGEDCDLNHIDVSAMTDFRSVFQVQPFTGDISRWNMSNAKSLCRMFQGSTFNGDISKWNVGQVTDFSDMFNNSRFNGDLSRWSVGNGENMSEMFAASAFEGDISRWDVSKVQTFKEMFRTTAFKGDLSQWRVGPTADMRDALPATTLRTMATSVFHWAYASSDIELLTAAQQQHWKELAPMAQAMGIEGNALIHWMHEQWCNKPTAQVQFELPAMEL